MEGKHRFHLSQVGAMHAITYRNGGCTNVRYFLVAFSNQLPGDLPARWSIRALVLLLEMRNMPDRVYGWPQTEFRPTYVWNEVKLNARGTSVERVLGSKP